MKFDHFSQVSSLQMESKKILLTSILLLVLLFVGYRLYLNYFSPPLFLTRDDVPRGAVFMKHVHSNEGQELDEQAHQKGETEHYATPEAIKNGGPIYGVHGFAIVAIEYEISETEIGTRPVGKDFPGWALGNLLLKFKNPIPYDHFHIGIKEDTEVGVGAESNKKYLIHFMLLPHKQELELGLSCG